MIQLSLRMKKDESCPDDLLESITNCLEQTLTYSHNHHHQLNKMAQMDKLRVLSAVIQQNLLAELPDYRLYCWVTEVGATPTSFGSSTPSAGWLSRAGSTSGSRSATKSPP